MSSPKATVIIDKSTLWIESKELLTDVLAYAAEHDGDNIDRLYLSIVDVPQRDILTHAIDQILARRKFYGKLSSFIENRNFIFPSILSAEQSTHQNVAQYHRHLFGKDNTILDMTAGLGIDAMTAGYDNIVTACEVDPLKAAALRHNVSALNVAPEEYRKVTVVNEDSLEYLQREKIHYNIIFADPARRGEFNSRVFNPADCIPDVVNNNIFLLSRSDRLIIKHSPMLDISSAIHIFSHLKSIHIVSHKGELKEVLTEQANDYQGPTEIICANILGSGEVSLFRCHRESGNNECVTFANISDITPGKYLYVPNASVMKIGPWDQLTQSFPDLKKLDPNTHIFISERYIPDFPGRIIFIDEILDKKKSSALKSERYNIICRNYVMQANELEKKLKVRPGDNQYIIGCKCNGRPILIGGHIK